MIGYVARRAVVAVIVLIGITIVTFALLQFISPSPGRAILGLKATPVAVASFNRTHGYDRAFVLQYLTYANHLLHGNLGRSYKLNQNVSTLIGQNYARSAYLSGVSLVLAIVVAIPLGVFQAVKRNSVADYVGTAVSFTLYSMPSFFLGLLLISLLCLHFHLFPVQASQSTKLIGVIKDPRSMVLPIVTLVAIQVANYSRYMRSAALDNLAQDYIRLARAKGLSERAVLSRHLLRNSILPMITLIGLSLPALVAGNLIVEELFNFPGLGLLFYNALGTEDYPVLLAYTLLGAVLTVAGNLLADVALTVADPRIRL
jgi:peptide/nickel transport system permease protein